MAAGRKFVANCNCVIGVSRIKFFWDKLQIPFQIFIHAFSFINHQQESYSQQ